MLVLRFLHQHTEPTAAPKDKKIPGGAPVQELLQKYNLQPASSAHKDGMCVSRDRRRSITLYNYISFIMIIYHIFFGHIMLYFCVGIKFPFFIESPRKWTTGALALEEWDAKVFKCRMVAQGLISGAHKEKKDLWLSLWSNSWGTTKTWWTTSLLLIVQNMSQEVFTNPLSRCIESH